MERTGRTVPVVVDSWELAGNSVPTDTLAPELDGRSVMTRTLGRVDWLEQVGSFRELGPVAEFAVGRADSAVEFQDRSLLDASLRKTSAATIDHRPARLDDRFVVPSLPAEPEHRTVFAVHRTVVERIAAASTAVGLHRTDWLEC